MLLLHVVNMPETEELSAPKLFRMDVSSDPVIKLGQFIRLQHLFCHKMHRNEVMLFVVVVYLQTKLSSPPPFKPTALSAVGLEKTLKIH